MRNNSVAVLTPTTACIHLEQCVESVKNQTRQINKHYIFADGVVGYEKYWQLVNKYQNEFCDVGYWPGKIGGVGWEGRRIYAAASFLINEDIICILNEDDWYLPNHIENIIGMIEKYELDWAYSLRSIYNKNGIYLFDDNCESLGIWKPYNNAANLVDSSAYAIKTKILANLSYVNFQKGYGPDRFLFSELVKNYNNFGCTGKHSLCYRLGGNEFSVSKEFLDIGNKIFSEKYQDGFPWHKEIYIKK